MDPPKKVIALAVMAMAWTGVTSHACAQDDPTINAGPGPSPSPTPTPAPLANWQIHLYNVDDDLYIICNGAQIGTVPYGKSGVIPLDHCLRVGQINHFQIMIHNIPNTGWTYGFQVLKNGRVAATVNGPLAEGQCGQVRPGAASISCTPPRNGDWKIKGYYIR